MNETAMSKEIGSRIFLVRGKHVMLDADPAELYNVETRILNQAVVRNAGRFPEDFMFQLTKNEFEFLRSQFVISKADGRGGRRYLPYAFTEHGILMLSSVLSSERAVQVNIAIMRAFVSLRRMVFTYESLRRKIDVMEKKYDGQFKVIFTAIRQLMEPPPGKPKREIGFHAEE